MGFFFFQAEDGIRDYKVTGVQTCALPICHESRTPRTLRELMILRGAQLMRSEYEWAQHLGMARKCGVREAQIAALAGWRASPEFDSREKAALALAEAVTQGNLPGRSEERR